MDDQQWLRHYNDVAYDRIRRRLGFLKEDEGAMDSVDRVRLMEKRGQIPNDEPVTEDSLRQRMRLLRKEPAQK